MHADRFRVRISVLPAPGKARSVMDDALFQNVVLLARGTAAAVATAAAADVAGTMGTRHEKLTVLQPYTRSR